MHDLRPQQPQPGTVAQVNLHPAQAGHGPHPDDWAAAVPSGAAATPVAGGSFEVTGMDPTPPPAPEPIPAPAPQAPAQPPAAPQPAAPQAPQTPPVQPAQPTPQTPAAPLPQDDEHHHALAQSLRSIKIGLIALIAILALAVGYFVWQGSQPSQPSRSTGGTSQQSGGDSSNAPSPASATEPRSVSCVGSTGTDASTDSKTFTDVEGTECTYRTGELPETLVLNGKLTGRNTEGTGMSVTLNVNGKVCTGGESLNYARTFTPMVSNCVFDVPANSAVAIKWQFLSPFGGSASVLRSSKNIAPSIVGTAIPKTEEGSGG